MGNQKKYGLAYERKRKKELMQQGYTASRTRGSFGDFDIIACNKEHLLLESVKATKKRYYSYKEALKVVMDFNNAPGGTIKRLVLYHQGKLKILYQEKL